ncbi:unnamed protein product, partial [Timema podura]|nr:unnamed protein product [Timema podura]
MCLRGDKIGYAPHLGLFLRELEDRLDIGYIQQKILISVTNQRAHNRLAEEAIEKLNSNLYDLT